MSRNSNHFLSFDAGASLSHLISTNSLVYDTSAGGIYYFNKSSVAKTGVNFISGLSYHSRGQNFELIIGPQASFALNKIFKSDLDIRKYFLYGGVGAAILFEQKKKK